MSQDDLQPNPVPPSDVHDGLGQAQRRAEAAIAQAEAAVAPTLRHMDQLAQCDAGHALLQAQRQAESTVPQIPDNIQAAIAAGQRAAEAAQKQVEEAMRLAERATKS